MHCARNRPCLRDCILPTGRSTPSVACIVQPGSNGGFQKVFFGDEEIAIPVYGRYVAGPSERTLLATLYAR